MNDTPLKHPIAKRGKTRRAPNVTEVIDYINHLHAQLGGVTERLDRLETIMQERFPTDWDVVSHTWIKGN